MTRQELIQELMEDSQTYCCYCGAPKVRFSCCGENHFETFAEMNKETQESILSDMASEVSDFWEGYVPEPVKPAQEPEQSDIFCGVDFADGMLSVSVLRRRADDVAELLHAEQIELPAQRTWVGLTDEEITDMWAESSPYYHEDDFARAIEAKLKEKNNG